MAKPSKPEFFQKTSIRYTIFVYFTVSALVMILLIGMSLYGRLAEQFLAVIREENQAAISQINQSVDSYLRTVMKLSDSLYYGVIKNADLSQEGETVNSKVTLLYDNNKDSVANIALLSKKGELLSAVPAARLKTGMDVTGEEWFKNTLDHPENLHFSMPHVQYIFDNSENQYRWVISLSRAVEITQGTSTDQGVLLIDIAYGSLQQLLDNVAMGNEGYLYLANSDGELIYHPKIQLIDAGLAQENTQTIQKFQDGNEQETFQGKKRDVVVKSVGYTGWKLVGVTPEQGFSLNHLKTRLFMVFVAAFFLFLLALINSYISSRITAPIQELEKSVNALEEGALDTEVYIGGSYEIQHLGRSIGDMAKRIQTLMEDIVAEHESKRKSEFDTLQSQINPHFLYNTLDIIVWMVENEQKQEAVKVVTALARFFRISLSRGKSIIPVKDELEHVRNYLMIQQMRFKNKFVYQIEAEPEVLSLASLKLMLQPLVENAIYHGMEFMDGDGEIVVKAWRQEGNLRFTIADNGLGMTTEQAAGLLTGRTHGSSRRGSGIGVKNVNERIRLYFGEEYGLVIWSEPDEGTKVEICLPAVPFEKLAEEDKP
ncbi:sensor histidine kinase [Clostridiaceae bacterium]|nr:sensor histidine kinase [Lachnospiraceae bacterium]NBH16921.1 sensor histidine kinase [Clostridiaceae bacterium]